MGEKAIEKQEGIEKKGNEKKREVENVVGILMMSLQEAEKHPRPKYWKSEVYFPPGCYSKGIDIHASTSHCRICNDR
jgi:hypothetical protein